MCIFAHGNNVYFCVVMVKMGVILFIWVTGKICFENACKTLGKAPGTINNGLEALTGYFL